MTTGIIFAGRHALPDPQVLIIPRVDRCDAFLLSVYIPRSFAAGVDEATSRGGNDRTRFSVGNLGVEAGWFPQLAIDHRPGVLGRRALPVDLQRTTRYVSREDEYMLVNVDDRTVLPPRVGRDLGAIGCSQVRSAIVVVVHIWRPQNVATSSGHEIESGFAGRGQGERRRLGLGVAVESVGDQPGFVLLRSEAARRRVQHLHDSDRRAIRCARGKA